MHRESALIKTLIEDAPSEAMIAGLAGGIGFVYVVFEYDAGTPAFCVVDRSRLPWHDIGPEYAQDSYWIGVTGQLRDTKTKTGWAKRFGTPEAFAVGAVEILSSAR
ncbi:hypothetical protein [Amycolatopsis sp. lyj-112]|uniref:hypothetical protein n=1 Tax=Amycolatopsis sp. lyj-112 TaxID=2789288 RepID=UPI00397C0C23